jgi:hypothetical protein
MLCIINTNIYSHYLFLRTMIIKHINKKLFLTILVIVFIRTATASKSKFENYRIILKDMIMQKIGAENLEGKKISDFTNKKTKNLSFTEAASLYSLYVEAENKSMKQFLMVLLRLYSICPDSKLSEHILWNIGLCYELHGDNLSASETFGIFKKLFPGSENYWSSRYHEITNAHLCTKQYNLDDTNTLFAITLCNEYIDDSNYTENCEYNDILEIEKKLYLKTLKRELYIAKQYVKKYLYMRTPECLFSSFQRLTQLNKLIKEELELERYTNKVNSVSTEHTSLLNKAESLLRDFFKKHEITIHSGDKYTESRNTSISYIRNNIKIFNYEIKELTDALEKMFK